MWVYQYLSLYHWGRPAPPLARSASMPQNIIMILYIIEKEGHRFWRGRWRRGEAWWTRQGRTSPRRGHRQRRGTWRSWREPAEPRGWQQRRRRPEELGENLRSLEDGTDGEEELRNAPERSPKRALRRKSKRNSKRNAKMITQRSEAAPAPASARGQHKNFSLIRGFLRTMIWVHTTQLTSKQSGLIGFAGQGANSLNRTGTGKSQRGSVSTMVPMLERLLTFVKSL